MRTSSPIDAPTGDMYMRNNARIEMPRSLVATIVAGVLIWTGCIVVATHFITYVEFTWATPSRTEILDLLPNVSGLYYQFHRYSWAGLAILTAWGTWLVFRRARGALAVSMYIAVAINLATLWFLITLLALYMINQTLM